MAQSQSTVKIDVQASTGQAVSELGRLAKELEQTNVAAEKNRKAWNQWSVANGQLHYDLEKFIENGGKYKNTTKDMGKEASGASRFIGNLKGSVAELAGELSGSSRYLGNFTQSLGGLGGFGGKGGLSLGAGLAAGFVTALGAGTAVEAQFQKIETAFTTLLGSATAAAEAMAMIKADAANTPFDVEGLARLNLQLTAITGNAQQSERILMNFGKAMTAMGKDSNDLNAVMVQVIQSLNKGKLEMQDVKPIQSHIDLYGIMSRNLGITRDRLMELQEAGQLSADMLLEAFERASNGSGEFSGAYENASNNLTNNWQNMIEKIKIGLGDFAQQTGVFDAVSAAFKGLNDVFDNEVVQVTMASIAGTFRTAGSFIIGMIASIIGAAQSLFTLSWDPFNNAVNGWMKGVEDSIKGTVANMDKVFAKGVDKNVDTYKQGNDAMARDNAKKLGRIAEQEADANRQFARQEEKRVQQFQESLRDMIISHRDKSRSIQADIEKENAAYLKASLKREQDYQDALADLQDRHLEKVAGIQKDLSDERKKGLVVDGILYQEANEEKIRELEDELVKEQDAYRKAVDKRRAQFEEERLENQERHDTRIAQLESSLSEELAILERHRADVAAVGEAQKQDDITRLKQRFDEQKAEAERNHREQLERIRRQGNEQGGGYISGFGQGVADKSEAAKAAISLNIRKAVDEGGLVIGDGGKDAATRFWAKFNEGIGQGVEGAKNNLKLNLEKALKSGGLSVSGGSVDLSRFSFGVTPRAGGGTTRPGETTLVGEEGPEIAQFPAGTRIYPADQTRRMLSTGRGVSVNIGTVINQSQADMASFLGELSWQIG